MSDEQEVLTFSGRQFRLINFDHRSALRDAVIQDALRATGVENVVPMDGDSDASYVERLDAALNDSLRHFDLLAAFLIPDDDGPPVNDFTNQGFSRELVAETSRHLQHVTAPAERDRLLPLALGCYASYLEARRRTATWFPRLFTRADRKSADKEELPDGLGLGEWSPIVRACAGHDYDRAQQVQHWPLVALLKCYQHILRERAWDSYKQDVLVWAALAPHQKKGQKPPKLPAILADANG